MRYDIVLAPEALDDLRKLAAHDRAKVRDALEAHLRYLPAKLSKSRIKRLRGLRRPHYRLRVENVRIFYDVSGGVVEVLAIVSKQAASAWLAAAGELE